jgi:hypothetical protein
MNDYQRLTYLRIEVTPPIEDPDQNADHGDDDEATLPVTELS